MNETINDITISTALGCLLSCCDDYVKFYRDILKVTTEVEFYNTLEKYEADVWCVFEGADWDFMVSEFQSFVNIFQTYKDAVLNEIN